MTGGTKMYLMAGLLAGLAAAANAQDRVLPDREADARRAMETAPDAPALRCQVTAVQPALDFSLRFHTGYVVTFPMNQFHGPKHTATVLVRVKPQDSPPAYFVSSLVFPDAPQAALDGRVGGNLLVGEGNYEMDAVVEDDLHRVCRANWHVQAKRSVGERRVISSMPAATVAAWPFRPALAETPPAADVGRLTVLLDAGSLAPRAESLRDSDVRTLIGSLSALLEQVPARTVTLAVFNLAQQKTLFRQDGFAMADAAPVVEALREARLGLVDYSVLQRPNGAATFLEELTRDAFQAATPADAVVFLGPLVHVQDPVPPEFIRTAPGGPRVFYVECRQPLILGRLLYAFAPGSDVSEAFVQTGGAELVLPDDRPDTIEKWVNRKKGEVLVVREPGDLVRAIRHIAPAPDCKR